MYYKKQYKKCYFLLLPLVLPYVTGTVARLVSLVAQVYELLFFSTLLHSNKDKKSLKALFLNFQTFLQGTHIEPVGTGADS